MSSLPLLFGHLVPEYLFLLTHNKQDSKQEKGGSCIRYLEEEMRIRPLHLVGVERGSYASVLVS